MRGGAGTEPSGGVPRASAALRPSRRAASSLLGLLAALLLAACPRSAPKHESPPREYPPGTVLAVDGAPITLAEIDRWAAVTARLEPDKVVAHWRRLALANVLLPLRAGSVLDPPRRQAAFEEAQRLHATALELDRVPPEASPDRAFGTWHDVGLVDWEIAREMAVGEWSPLYETIGGWSFFRLLERPAEWGPIAPIAIERVNVFYLAPEGLRVLIDDAMRQLPLEVVDPAYESIVPPLYMQNAVVRAAAPPGSNAAAPKETPPSDTPPSDTHDED